MWQQCIQDWIPKISLFVSLCFVPCVVFSHAMLYIVVVFGDYFIVWSTNTVVIQWLKGERLSSSVKQVRVNYRPWLNFKVKWFKLAINACLSFHLEVFYQLCQLSLAIPGLSFAVPSQSQDVHGKSYSYLSWLICPWSVLFFFKNSGQNT